MYGPAHIGNFRTFVLNDVLYRTAIAAGMNPFFVRNITDVDDKTIRDSQADGSSLEAFTTKWTQAFHEDCESLNMLPPDVEPRATAHIQEQMDIIQQLMDKGHAYQGGDGSIYYKVSTFEDYGKLSHFNPEELRTQDINSAGAANLADEYDREQVADFALWKAYKPEDGEVGWDSPWGKGRPGWHLECSAMSMKYLGETFDLHTGGEDLTFPHHENEIAQSEACTGHTFAHHWMHVVFLLVEGKKMSKSLGNFFTLRDLMAKGYDPMAVRYALISGHYRKQLNFTFHTLDAAQSALDKLGRVLDTTDPRPPFGPDKGRFEAAWKLLLADLNTPATLGSLFANLKAFDPDREADLNGLATVLFALGIKIQPESTDGVAIPEEIHSLAQARWEAKRNRDFQIADALRDEIQGKGWKVLDRKDGFDLEPL